MELGGNAPFIVLADADLDAAVAGAMVAKMRNGGAACTAANRFYVHAPVADEFSRRLADGDGRAARRPRASTPASEIGSLVSVAERDKVAELVDAACRRGRQAVVGGSSSAGTGASTRHRADRRRSPTRRSSTTRSSGRWRRSSPSTSDDEAVRLANATPYGPDRLRLLRRPASAPSRVADRLDAGMVGSTAGIVSDPAAPFGGMKESGIGREGGFEGIHEFPETKYIAASL